MEEANGHRPFLLCDVLGKPFLEHHMLKLVEHQLNGAASVQCSVDLLCEASTWRLDSTFNSRDVGRGEPDHLAKLGLSQTLSLP
ncbi:hypothetical protein KPATCC21470_6205 [Kitasatospora purpeofusca]